MRSCIPRSGLSPAPLIQLVLALVILIINRAYFTSGFRAMAQLRPNMDSLVAVGAGISLVYSLYTSATIFMGVTSGTTETAFHGLHNLYYDSAAMIVALITIGKYLEARAKRHTSDAISELLALAPKPPISSKARTCGQSTPPMSKSATSSRCVLAGAFLSTACS